MKPETRASLVQEATMLVRRHGYAGFSYADLADAVGIRKPSIHHHFPLKEDLGVAIVEEYTALFAERLADIAATTDDWRGRLTLYADLYRVGLLAGQACLCGVLASELAGLPARVRAGVARFFEANVAWLERVLRDRTAARPHDLARTRAEANLVLATCQGAIFVALATGAPDAFDRAVAELLAGLTVAPAVP